MTIQERISLSRIPPATIAKGIGMSRGTFNNKLKGNNNARFSIGEIEQIELFLKSVCESIKDKL